MVTSVVPEVVFEVLPAQRYVVVLVPLVELGILLVVLVVGHLMVVVVPSSSATLVVVLPSLLVE